MNKRSSEYQKTHGAENLPKNTKKWGENGNFWHF